MRLNQWIVFILVTCAPFINFAQDDYLRGLVRDANTQAPLPFATIQYQAGKGVLANENGEFRIARSKLGDSLQITYVGYDNRFIAIAPEQTSLEVELVSVAISIDEILVLGQDLFASALFYKAIQKSRKAASYRSQSKCFRRSYSFREEEPSEHMEAFYSAKMHQGGVDQFDLKNGRYGVPSDTSFINLQMTDMLETFKLYSGKFNKLPGAPTQYTKLKKLRKDFDVRIIHKYQVKQDTIYEISFVPFQKADQLFTGKAWVRYSNLIIEKIELDIKATSKRPLIIVPDTEDNKIERMDLSFVFGFKYNDNRAVMDYIHSDYAMNISTPVVPVSVRSATNFYFYEYGDPFDLPLFPNVANNFHDYEKILCFDYNPDFWKINYLIAETQEERAFRKELETKRLFKNQQGGQQSTLIRRRFDLWNPMWKIEPLMVADREFWKGEELDQIVYMDRKSVPPEYIHFAKTFIFLDYECYADTILFNAEAVMDYRFSFATERKLEDFIYLEDFLHLTKIHANQLEQKLSANFANQKNCPDRRLIKELWAAANTDLEKAIEKYNQQIHLATKNGRRKRSSALRKRLAESFNSEF